jgi:hypothetical protein
MSLRYELEAYLGARGVQVLSLRRLAGGASQEDWLVHVSDDRGSERDMVLRRDMGDTC